MQIIGEIKAARDALVEITSRLRNYLFRESTFPKDLQPPSISSAAPVGSMFGLEAASPSKIAARENYQGSEPPITGYQNLQNATLAWPSKDAGGCSNVPLERKENDGHDDPPSVLHRIPVPLVTRSTLEVVIPEHAIPKLIMRSGNKLAQISEVCQEPVLALLKIDLS
uniref:KH domain-containing protein At4g18375-like n=1 Tax=Nelumbo nucifera TaxID=4432 RepID=A0A822Z3W7_NELNU|nr:TPA_asm: hypothetical protein HUJ06_006858 [Nelumbo nucifera]